MKKKLDKIVLLLILAVLFYGAMLIYADVEIVVKKIFEINWKYIPIILSLIGIQIGILGFRYHRLLKKLGISIPFKESFKLFVAGLSMTITPLGGGTGIKSYLLKKKFGYSISSTLPIILVERWTELLSILILMIILLFFTTMYASYIAIILGLIMVGVLVIITSNSKLFTYYKKFFLKIKYLRKFSMSLEESKNSIKILYRKKTVFEAIGLSFVSKIIQLFAVFYIFLAVGVEFDFFQAGQIYYTSIVFGSISFIPGGIIVTESSMLGLLLENGIQVSIATLIVILSRLVTIWLFTIVGTVALKFEMARKPES